MSKKNIFDSSTSRSEPPAQETVPVTQTQGPASTTDEPQEQVAEGETTVTNEPEKAGISTPQRAIDANMVNALKTFVSADPSRYVLQGIFFGKDDNGRPIAVATDGRKIAVAEQVVIDASEFPVFPNGGIGQDSGDDVIVPVRPLMEALRKVPKKTTLPILQTPPIISLKNDKGEVTQACVPVTDLDTHTIETTRVIDGHFPNFRQVIPPENRTAIEVVVDANHMLDMAASALAFCKNGSSHMVPMKLCIGFENSAPLRVEVADRNKRKLTMVLMPMRDCGDLVNRIEHRGLVAVTERLEAVATQLETIGLKKPRKTKDDKAEMASGSEPLAKAA